LNPDFPVFETAKQKRASKRPGQKWPNLGEKAGCLICTIARQAMGNAVHFAASLAGAVGICIFRGGSVSTGEAKESLIGPAQHGPELAAENAIRTANDFLQHSS
jgi:hypothetical protein